MNKDFIEQLKNQVSIVDVISKKVKLQKKGNDYFGRCPFHNEKTASFKVSSEKGLYYCFGCGASGDAINFHMEFEKCSFNEAVKSLAESIGMNVPTQHLAKPDLYSDVYCVLNLIKNWFSKELFTTQSSKAFQYLTSRKINIDSIKKFEIGIANNSNNLLQFLQKQNISEEMILKTGVFYKSKNGLINRYHDRIVFPILDANAQCVGFGGRLWENNSKEISKYINSPESDVYIKSNQLYGYCFAKKSIHKKIILCEGYLDVISMHQAGFDCAVAPLGTAISSAQIHMCWKSADTPIVLLDGDVAGIKASYRWIDKFLSELIPGKSFLFAKLPQEEDPDSLIFNDNNNIIENAIKFPSTLIDWMWDGAFSLHPSDLPEQKAEIIQNLYSKISIIKDINIKKLYELELKKREYNLLKYITKNKYKKINLENNINPLIRVDQKIEQVLLAYVLFYPNILQNLFEDFSKIPFSFEVFENLKKKILDLYYIFIEQKDENEFHANIKELKEIFITKYIKNSNISMFFDKTEEESCVIDIWYCYFNELLKMKNLNMDLQKAVSDLKLSFSDDAWKRLKALKCESIYEKEKLK